MADGKDSPGINESLLTRSAWGAELGYMFVCVTKLQISLSGLVLILVSWDNEV